LSGNSPVVLRDEFDETKHEKGVKSKIVDRGQITFRNGTPEFLSPIKRLARMHIARNYETGSKRSGALFSRDGLVPGTQFTCWAYVPGDAFVSGEKWEWTFGKRKSAGNGRATIRAVEVNSPELFESVSKETCDVYVHLLSPLLLRDASGNPTRSMDKTLWKQLVGTLDLPDDTGFVAMTWNRRVGGWMSGWNHRRASVTVVAEGSVWRFRFNTQEAAKTMRTTLSTFLPQIGERRHEGFGWFALDPPWLGRGSNAAPVSQQTSPPERETTAELNREDRIIARMQTMPLNAGALKPLNELAARLREANESVLTPLKEYWHGRCNRENAGVWQHIAPETDVGRLLTGCWTNLEDLRFTIEALSIRATEKREG